MSMGKPRHRLLTWNTTVLLFAIFLAFFLRFNQLDRIPPGLNRDEVSVGYNAYSIILTGRDEHGRFLPVYFEAIGDQKLPMMIYIPAVSIHFFGLTPFGVRFPFALLGSLTVVFTYFLIKKGLSLEHHHFVWLPTLSALLLAINPWHIYHSRAAYEVCLGLFFFTLGTYSILRGLRSKTWFMVAITAFIIAFYSYSMTRLLSPLLLLFFLSVYRSAIQKYSKTFFLFVIVYGGILLLPFFLTFFDPGGITAPKGAVILTSSAVKSEFLEFRSYILHSPVAFLGPLLFNRVVMTIYEYFRNILSALSPKFFFVSGTGPGGAGIGTIGQFYLIESVALISGLLYVVRGILQRNRFFLLLIGWMVITILTASLTINPPDSYASRMYFMIVPMITIIALGWLHSAYRIQKNKLLAHGFVFTLVVVYIWYCSFYLASYYFRFPIVYAQNWSAKAGQLFDYLARYEDEVDYIVITKPERSMYAFLLFYHQIPPEQVWEGLERYPPDPDGWKHARKFGKYEFREIDWRRDNTDATNAILVAEGGEYPDRQAVTAEITYPIRHAVYPLGQEIIALPEERVAYRIWRVRGRMVK